MPVSHKHGRSPHRPSRPVTWRYLVLTLLLAVGAGGLSYAFVPVAAVAPVADRLTAGAAFTAPALPSLLGQVQDGSYASPSMVPVAAATAAVQGPAKRKPPRTLRRVPVPPPSSSPPSASAAGLGIYDGEFGPAGIETAAQWLGSPTSIKYAEDFVDATDFSHISDPWQLSNWKGSPFTMVWGVPMVPCGAPSTQCATNVADFNEVADGGADSYYTTLAKNLVAAGFGSSYIRLGWEFNGTWMGWSICDQAGSGLASWASDFVPAFQHIVTSMRAVSGANFKFIWNPDDSSNASCPGANLENFYPGDSYVDMVALDVYDGIGAATSSDATRWTDMVDGVNAGGWTAVTPAAIGGQRFEGYGLNWLAAFGQAHHKEVGLPEWGLESSDSNSGGGDDPYFVTQMANWIKANATGPVIFWNDNDGTLQLDIPHYTSGDTPNATAAFRTAFGTAG